MIDRDLLTDIGFVLGSGWDHEVWVYDGLFWVHFGDNSRPSIPEASINGQTETRKELFTKLLKRVQREAQGNPEDWQ